jgi:hypothetical protein
VAEYAVLSAPCFGELLQRYGLRVERLSRVLDSSRVPAQAAVA